MQLACPISKNTGKYDPFYASQYAAFRHRFLLNYARIMDEFRVRILLYSLEKLV